jgi:hypothetical protein
MHKLDIVLYLLIITKNIYVFLNTLATHFYLFHIMKLKICNFFSLESNQSHQKKLDLQHDSYFCFFDF